MADSALLTAPAAGRTPAAPEIFSHGYYRRLREVEDRHWWTRGMRDVAAALLDGLPRTDGPLDVLDAGCGTGGTLEWLGRRSPTARTVGADLSPHALAYCRSRGHGRLVEASVLRLPFADETFDLILCFDVLQHLPRPDGDATALREFYRLLRPGGKVLLRSNARLAGDGESLDADYRRYRLEELAGLVAQTGFDLRRLTYANSASFWTERVRPRRRINSRANDTNPGLRIRLLPRWLAPANCLLYQWLRLEARRLRNPSRVLKHGHTTFCLAAKPDEPATMGGLTHERRHHATNLCEPVGRACEGRTGVG